MATKAKNTLPNYHLLAAQQEPYKKSLSLSKPLWKTFWGEKVISKKKKTKQSKRTWQINKRADRKE